MASLETLTYDWTLQGLDRSHETGRSQGKWGVLWSVDRGGCSHTKTEKKKVEERRQKLLFKIDHVTLYASSYRYKSRTVSFLVRQLFGPSSLIPRQIAKKGDRNLSSESEVI